MFYLMTFSTHFILRLFYGKRPLRDRKPVATTTWVTLSD